jgi:hypothetical protein
MSDNVTTTTGPGPEYPNPNLTPQVTHQPSLLGGAENIKLLFDEELDNRRENLANARAWETLKLKTATDAQAVSNLAQLNAVISAQVSNIETQQTVSPVRTATGDAIVGGVGVSAEQVAANVANLATALVPVIASALATAISQTIAALVPAVVTASGGASTPSQTTTKAAA